MGDFEGKLLKDLKDDPLTVLAFRFGKKPPPGALETGEEFAKRINRACTNFADMTGAEYLNRLSSPRRGHHGNAFVLCPAKKAAARVGGGQRSGYTLAMSTSFGCATRRRGCKR
jgi:hypothetical protein